MLKLYRITVVAGGGIWITSSASHRRNVLTWLTPHWFVKFWTSKNLPPSKCVYVCGGGIVLITCYLFYVRLYTRICRIIHLPRGKKIPCFHEGVNYLATPKNVFWGKITKLTFFCFQIFFRKNILPFFFNLFFPKPNFSRPYRVRVLYCPPPLELKQPWPVWKLFENLRFSLVNRDFRAKPIFKPCPEMTHSNSNRQDPSENFFWVRGEGGQYEHGKFFLTNFFIFSFFFVFFFFLIDFY